MAGAHWSDKAWEHPPLSEKMQVDHDYAVQSEVTTEYEDRNRPHH